MCGTNTKARNMKKNKKQTTDNLQSCIYIFMYLQIDDLGTNFSDRIFRYFHSNIEHFRYQTSDTRSLCNPVFDRRLLYTYIIDFESEGF